MQSQWEKLENIRVVDAGYLLAGMEPERKWQYAPPMVSNFFNLIRDKTGAVKLATLPGERMEITRAEFQALKAEYGVTPATAPTTAPASNEAERLAERELLAAFSETVNNGASLNWRYWVHQLPTLTIAEAARLMCGLDPDLFKSLESRPNKNDQRQLCFKAAMIQRLAEREGKESATPGEWITWAGRHQIAVHDGFRLEVESAPAQTTATPSPVSVVALGGTATLWTLERKTAARAMQDELRGQGNKAFAATTAAKFGVTATRLREVLNDKPKKAPAKKAKGVWDV
jgi:hypothetical protein